MKKQKLELDNFSEERRQNLEIFTLRWSCDTNIISNEQHQQTQLK
jgi:hypothetical protein